MLQSQQQNVYTGRLVERKLFTNVSSFNDTKTNTKHYRYKTKPFDIRINYTTIVSF